MNDLATIKELSIDGSPILGETWGGRGGSTFGISRGTQWGYPVAPGFLVEDWCLKNSDFIGGGSSNIEGDIPIDGPTDGIKFGEERTGVWPSGGGGRNIDPTETIEFGGSDFIVWPPGEPEGS